MKTSIRLRPNALQPSVDTHANMPDQNIASSHWTAAVPVTGLPGTKRYHPHAQDGRRKDHRHPGVGLDTERTNSLARRVRCVDDTKAHPNAENRQAPVLEPGAGPGIDQQHHHARLVHLVDVSIV
jgi:hypothetical protein